MNNEQILKKAIERAEKNGYEFSWARRTLGEIDFNVIPINEIIFSHDFAKAFWGEACCMGQEDKNNRWRDTACCSQCGCFFNGKIWQYNLQSMVLEPNPLKYIAGFLEERK